MSKEEKIKIYLLKKYGVAILHMRRQLFHQRLGIVLGAGVSKSIGFADWDDLIKEIAKSDQVDGTNVLEKSNAKTITTQLLYQKFKSNYISKNPKEIRNKALENYEAFGDIEARKEWKKLVKDILYDKIPMSIDELAKDDKYIKDLITLIQKTSVMTVNYNFDDTIEKFLHKFRPKNQEESTTTRGYTVVWDPNVQAEKRNNIVYHPNGYLPSKLSEFTSEQMVFCEDSFEDQLIESFGGHYNALINHYSSATCLFIGISLEDRTLKHMLRQNSKKCYGHIHYYIHYINDPAIRESSEYIDYMQSFTNANFETYNLYSMFLTNEEISCLAQLISMSNDDFRYMADRADINVSRRYYVMGSVAVGKSTTVNQLRCLETHDEWLEEMPTDMEKSPDIVEDKIIETIDSWIANQVYKKNLYLHKFLDEACVNIIDRSPIDALAFTEKELWKEKAELLLKNILVGRRPKKLLDGVFIFLYGDKNEMYRRSIKKFRDYSPDALEMQQEKYKHLINGIKRDEGDIYEINVTNKTIEQVTKEVANVIFFDEYKESPIHIILEKIKEKGWEFFDE